MSVAQRIYQLITERERASHLIIFNDIIFPKLLLNDMLIHVFLEKKISLNLCTPPSVWPSGLGICLLQRHRAATALGSKADLPQCPGIL